MRYTMIVIGDELLIGQVTDTNSGAIARLLSPYGWRSAGVRIISDDTHEIVRAVDEALACTELVLVTGGLGPTKDDVTKHALAGYFGGRMVRNSEVAARNEEMFARRGLAMNELTAGQALVPESCRVIVNEVGTAPLMWFERAGRVVVAMPGVPHETLTMMRHAVVPMLQEHFGTGTAVLFRTFLVVDYAESALAERLSDFEAELPDYIQLAYLPKPGVVRLRLTGEHADGARLEQEMDRLGKELQRLLGASVIGGGDRPLEEILGCALRDRGLTLATAESCTGGNIAHAITRIAGSSDYFLGSVVSYSNSVKEQVLGVDAGVLEAEGAVSEPVVRQMARGACRVTGAYCAVATSGVAGPGGGSAEKPVGTVWIAARAGEREVAVRHQFSGDREQIIERATNQAMLMLLRLVAV